MRLAFAIVSLFPWGGLQRDCLRLARLVAGRGHEVTIFAARREGDLPADLAIEMLPVRALTNHGRNRRFGEALAKAAGGFDRVIGFNKLSGLDLLYCADPCLLDRPASPLVRLMPRWRTLRALEAACFAPDSKTHVLALAEPQIKAYRRAWRTPAERISLLPPNIDARRRRPELRSDGTREKVRAALKLPPQVLVWLAVATQPRVKGLDRAVQALAASEGHLVVAGVSADTAGGRELTELAAWIGARDRLHLLGPREDIPELMAAADLLVHPARLDTTGTVILEAIVNGLPVIATAVCGFSVHVSRADAGIVLPEPFQQRALADALAGAEDQVFRSHWTGNAIAYGADPELYRGLERAADAIVKGRR